MEGFIFLIVIVVVLSQAAARRDLVRAARERLLKNPGLSVEREGETEIPFDLDGRRARSRIPDEGGRALVEVGEPAVEGRRLHVFDRAWVVRGDLAPRIFSPESRADVVALRNHVDPCVEIAGGRLRGGLGQAPASELTVRDLPRAARAVLDASSAGECWDYAGRCERGALRA